MPMVLDTSDMGTETFSMSLNGAPQGSVVYPSGRQRYQYGFRSKPLTPLEREALDSIRNTQASWSDSYKLIQVDDYEYGTHASFGRRAVNPRVYREVSQTPGVFSGSFETSTLSGGKVNTTSVTTQAAGTIAPQGSWMGPSPSDDSLRSIGSKLFRNCVPESPAQDLSTFLGESRDIPDIGRLSNYKPTTIRGMGSSYLNWVFGVTPTVSDVRRFIDTIPKTASLMRDYVAHERMRVRRSRSETISERSGTASIAAPGAAGRNGSISLDGSTAGVYVISPYAFPISGGRLNFQAIYAHTVRSYGLFEYFVPRPTNLIQRLETYSKQAQRALGSSFEASTAWELARYSWLIDWFCDIGGLLRYQQAVAGNNVVATRSGWTSERRMDIFMSATGTARSVLPPVISSVIRLRGSAVASIRDQKREPGGPFSILNPGGLSSNQIAVLGALGVSR